MRTKKNVTLLLLLCSTIIIPSLLMFMPNANATFMGESAAITFNTTDYTNASIGFDSEGRMWYTFTRIQIEANDFEICLGNNSNGEDTLEDYILLSEAEGNTNPMNTTENHNSMLWVDNNTVHVVWQGKHSGQSDYDIFYTNTTGFDDPRDNIINVTDSDLVDETDPSIAVINGTIFIAYFDGTDIKIKTNLGDSIDSTGNAYDLTSGNARKPLLSTWGNETDWRLDFSYIDSSNNIIYQDLENGQAIGSLGGVIGTISNDGSDIIDHSLDSGKNMAAFCYREANNEIYVANSSDTTPKQITTNGLVEGDPDVVINDNDLITTFFVRNQSGQSYIMSADNYGSYFSNIETLIDKNSIPNATVINLYISSFDAKMCPGDGIILLYDGAYDEVAKSTQRAMYISGYINLYNDGEGGYNSVEWEEALMGEVFADNGWLLEGITFNYNLSSGENRDLLINITDTITGETWNNITTISGTGENEYDVHFFQPGDYFIANNIFTVELRLNDSENKDVMKVEIDPLEFSSEMNNATSYSNLYENGTIFPYTIEDQTTGFEGTIFFWDKNAWNRENPEADGTDLGTFSSKNHIDMYSFYMLGGEQYNISLTTTGEGSENCRVLIFNSTHQITDPNNALKNYDMGTYNETFFQFHAENEDYYYFIIENIQYDASYNYKFEHIVCPMTAKLLSPKSLYVGNDTVRFSWNINDAEEDFDYYDEESEINRYIFVIYDNNFVEKYNSTEDNDDPLGKAKFIEVKIVGGLEENDNETDLIDGIYYWQVIIVGSNYQWSAGVKKEFRLDTTPPDSPILAEPDGINQIGFYQVNWTTPSDGQFSVSYYELHRGDTVDFVPNDQTRITFGAELKNNYYKENNMKTDVYYYKVIAVDNVGLKSEPSNPGRYVVSLFGYVDPKGQDIMVLPGDYLEYQLVDVYNEDSKDPNDLYITFKDINLQMYSYIHFTITTASDDEVIPVEGNMYRKWMNTTAQQLEEDFVFIDRKVDLFPLVTSPDTDYQKEVFDLFLLRQFENASGFEHELKKEWYSDTFSTIEVYVHTFYTSVNIQNTYSETSFYYDAATFIVDARTGVVIEMVIFDELNNEGFSLKLTNTNIGLAEIRWWVTPLIIIASLAIIAAIINQIVKRLERRV